MSAHRMRVASCCTKDISRTLFVSLMKKGFLELDGWQKSASRLLQDGLMGSVGASKKKSSTQRNRNVSYRPLAAKGHRKGQAKVLEQKQRYPATLSQQAYWYAYQSNPNDASNHTHICAQIEGDLVYSVLHAAFKDSSTSRQHCVHGLKNPMAPFGNILALKMIFNWKSSMAHIWHVLRQQRMFIVYWRNICVGHLNWSDSTPSGHCCCS